MHKAETRPIATDNMHYKVNIRQNLAGWPVAFIALMTGIFISLLTALNFGASPFKS